MNIAPGQPLPAPPSPVTIVPPITPHQPSRIMDPAVAMQFVAHAPTTRVNAHISSLLSPIPTIIYTYYDKPVIYIYPTCSFHRFISLQSHHYNSIIHQERGVIFYLKHIIRIPDCNIWFIFHANCLVRPAQGVVSRIEVIHVIFHFLETSPCRGKGAYCNQETYIFSKQNETRHIVNCGRGVKIDYVVPTSTRCIGAITTKDLIDSTISTPNDRF